MSLSAFALVLGVTLYLVSFPMIFLDKKAIAWRKRLSNSEDSLRVFGWVFGAVSVLVLKTQWNVTADADGILVVMAWLTLVKSVVLAWFPAWYIDSILPIKEQMTATATSQMFFGFVGVILAAFFTYLGVVLI